MACGLRNFGKLVDDDELAPSFDKMPPDPRDIELTVLRGRVTVLEKKLETEKKRAEIAEAKLEIFFSNMLHISEHGMCACYNRAKKTLAAIAAIKP